MLKLLENFLSFSDMRIRTLLDGAAIDMVFSLLIEPQPVRDLGVSLTVGMYFASFFLD